MAAETAQTAKTAKTHILSNITCLLTYAQLILAPPVSFSDFMEIVFKATREYVQAFVSVEAVPTFKHVTFVLNVGVCVWILVLFLLSGI